MRVVTSAVLLLSFLAVLVATLGARGSGTYPLVYSQLLLAGIVLLLGAITIEELRTARATNGDQTGDEESISWRSIAGLVAVCLYASLWNVIGYAPATALFLLVALVIAGVHHSLTIFILATLLPTALHLIFVKFLQIPLPAPFWF